MKKINLNSFSESQKLHTGFYSKHAYVAFKDICREMKRNNVFGWCYKAYALQSPTSEVIVCTDLQDHSCIWKNNCIQYPSYGETGNLTLREAMKIAIAEYATITHDCLEIQAWAKGNPPIDQTRFEELIGTPENPIKAEMIDLAREEELKINVEFDALREEISNRKFESVSALFANDITIARGHKGYGQPPESAKHLSPENMEKLYAAEKEVHDALMALTQATNAYNEIQQKWYAVNKEIRHLLTVEKNKEIVKFRKNLKAMMKA